MDEHQINDSEIMDSVADRVDRAISTLTTEDAKLIQSTWNSGASTADLRQKLNQILTNAFNRERADKTMTEITSDSDISTIVERMLLDRTTATESHVNLQLLLKNPVTGDALPSEHVIPTPVFQGKRVRMKHGFVKTKDLHLWGENERLQLFLDRFADEKEARTPTAEEIYEMMMAPATSGEDTEFKIRALAGSIAKDGVKRPPILDKDGLLRDGNRRVTASFLIQMTGEPKYSREAIKRVEYTYVWQMEDEEDVDAVLVALNFVDEFREPWPEYVKARKVYKDYVERTQISPTKERELAIRKDLQREYGITLVDVGRYLNMMSWAGDFEDYFVGEKNENVHDVRQAANRYIYYFEEMAKGNKPGSVAYELKQQEGLKHLVFDLLRDGKFQSWKQIREIKYINDDPIARKALQNSRQESNQELAQEHFDDAMAIAYAKRAAERQKLGTEVKIKALFDWLSGLGREDLLNMSLENLKDLQDMAEDLNERLGRAILRKMSREEVLTSASGE